MLFNSYLFFLFFAVVLGVYACLRRWQHKKLWLLIASCLFYASFNPPFVLLLAFSSTVDWILGFAIHRAQTAREKKAWLIVSLFLNLGLLGFFKYFNFLMESGASVLNALGLNVTPVFFEIFLPIGISFYTFQTLSYTIDIYRGKILPETSLLNYSLYVSFFPQLDAGPIVRAHEFLPQCQDKPQVNWNDVGFGFFLLSLGLFQKITLADAVFSPVADQVFDRGGGLSAMDSWCGTLAFGFQIFFDFAGYSTCAIGLGKIFGFQLPENFRSPYAALGFSDFWRRWHISLSQWLRDYLYIPLGGNRATPSRRGINLFLTMFLGGLWHGAAWHFVVWGMLHGAFLILENQVRTCFRPDPSTHILHNIPALCGTFLAVNLTWVFFRSPDLGSAMSLIRALFLFGKENSSFLRMEDTILVFSVAAISWMTQICLRNHSQKECWERCSLTSRIVIWSGCILGAVLISKKTHAFIYFQF